MKVGVAIAMVSTLFGIGCRTVLEVGVPPKTELLESALRVGTSRRGTVLEVLGAPDGVGKTTLPDSNRQRTIWEYHYQRSEAGVFGRTYLFVFFLGPVYDGYLWFSSAPPHIRTINGSARAPTR